MGRGIAISLRLCLQFLSWSIWCALGKYYSFGKSVHEGMHDGVGGWVDGWMVDGWGILVRNYYIAIQSKLSELMKTWL